MEVASGGPIYTNIYLPVPNLPLCHLSSQSFDLHALSSTDVPILLLNQPNNLWKRLGNILVLGPTCVQGFYYTLWLACLKSHCQFTNRLNGNSECISSNSLNPLRGLNKDVGTALQTLRTRLRLYMQHRLKNKSMSVFKVQRKYRFLRALLVRE